MKYSVIVRSRALKSVSIEKKHETLINGLSHVPEPWGFKGKEPPPTPDPGKDLIAVVGAKKHLGNGISSAYFTYQYRREFRDEAAHDDYISIDFNSKKADYGFFTREVLPIYIESFGAYLAYVANSEFLVMDFDDAPKGFDNRRNVFRVYPVSFYDELLCERAFGLKPSEVCSKLVGKVEAAREFFNGVYILGSSSPQDLDHDKFLCQKLKEFILA